MAPRFSRKFRLKTRNVGFILFQTIITLSVRLNELKYPQNNTKQRIKTRNFTKSCTNFYFEFKTKSIFALATDGTKGGREGAHFTYILCFEKYLEILPSGYFK